MMLDRVVEMSAIEAPESYGVEEFKDLLDKSSGYSELRSNYEKFVENDKMTLVARNVAHNLRDNLFESHKDENGKVDYEAVGQELALYRESLIARDKDRSTRMLEKYEIRDMKKILGSVQASARYYANAERLSEYEREHGDVFVLRNELKGAALTVKKVSLMDRAEKEWLAQTEENIEINLLAQCEQLKREIVDDLGGEVPLTKVDKVARTMARKSARGWKRKVVGYGMVAAFIVTSFVAGVSSWWNNQRSVQDFSVSRAPVATAIASENSDDVIKNVQRKGDAISLEKPVSVAVQEPEAEKEVVTPKIEPANPSELRGPEIVESSLQFDDVTRLEDLQKEVMEKYGNGVFLYPVSKDQRLPDDYPKEKSEFVLVSVDSEANEIAAAEGGGSLQVAEVIKEPLKEMFTAAKKDGQEPYLRSGFRSIGTQNVLFKSNV